jgi:stalled ribosome rescue protein Dom34
MTPFHAAVWLDHQQAKIFHVDEHRFDESLIHAPNFHVHRDPAAAEQYYHRVAGALETAGDVLVVGPGSAKLAFIKHVQKHHPKLDEKVVGVETVDHPTDKQLVGYIRKYFHAADRMRGLVP